MKKKIQEVIMRMLIIIRIFSIIKMKDAFSTNWNLNTFHPKLQENNIFLIEEDEG